MKNGNQMSLNQRVSNDRNLQYFLCTILIK